MVFTALPVARGNWYNHTNSWSLYGEIIGKGGQIHSRHDKTNLTEGRVFYYIQIWVYHLMERKQSWIYLHRLQVTGIGIWECKVSRYIKIRVRKSPAVYL